MKIANILMMALSSHMARAGQHLSVPDDETNLLQMETPNPILRPFRKRVAAVTGMHGFFSGKEAPEDETPFVLEAELGHVETIPESHVFPLPVDSRIGWPVWMADCDPEASDRDGKPCQNCIDRSDPGVYEGKGTLRNKGNWKGTLDDKKEQIPWGAGHQCCLKLTAAQLKIQPLCGVCIRARGGTDHNPNVALSGAWGFNPKCAQVYCEASNLRFAMTDAYMKKLAANCGGFVDLTNGNQAGSSKLQSSAVGHFTEEFKTSTGKYLNEPIPPIYGSCFDPAKSRPEVFMAVIANNPRKVDIGRIFADNADNLYKLKGHITGTGSSSKQCSATVCKIKGEPKETCLLGGSTTTSGPYGGDVQCGGIVAEDYTLGQERGSGFTPAIAGMVFTNDEREPHRFDIIALKRQVGFAFQHKPRRVSWHEDGVSPAAIIEAVAQEWETASLTCRRSLVTKMQEGNCGWNGDEQASACRRTLDEETGDISDLTC